MTKGFAAVLSMHFFIHINVDASEQTAPELLAQIIEARPDVYTFDLENCFECRRADITWEKVVDGRRGHKLNTVREAAIIALLAERAPYLDKYQKPCPQIFPGPGVLFSSGNQRILLVIYPGCKTARLLTNDSEFRVINIDLIYDRLREILIF